jgi:hypothetical protein
VAVSVQYRLAQEAPFAGAVCDVKCGVRWLWANAGVFKIDQGAYAPRSSASPHWGTRPAAIWLACSS